MVLLVCFELILQWISGTISASDRYALIGGGVISTSVDENHTAKGVGR